MKQVLYFVTSSRTERISKFTKSTFENKKYKKLNFFQKIWNNLSETIKGNKRAGNCSAENNIKNIKLYYSKMIKMLIYTLYHSIER